MAMNPLQRAHKSALRMNEDIGSLFAQTGTAEHPRGFVPTAYRNAKRAMRSALAEADPLTAARDVFEGLRSGIRSEALGLFLDAQQLGTEESARQLRFYDIQSTAGASMADRATARTMLDAVLARIDAQDMTTRALILTGAEPEQIVGDDERAGIMRPSDIAPMVGSLAATLVWLAFSEWTNRHTSSGELKFSKQSVAGLDERTTECCLRAHGQIQPLDGKFHLTGTPRYADYLDWTPFHYWCRTSIALYLPMYDDGLTATMRAAANQIINERLAGGTGYRDPANAFS
jgi:hypothetical protein